MATGDPIMHCMSPLFAQNWDIWGQEKSLSFITQVFSESVIDRWTGLPQSVIDNSSINWFKNSLERMMKVSMHGLLHMGYSMVRLALWLHLRTSLRLQSRCGRTWFVTMRCISTKRLAQSCNYVERHISCYSSWLYVFVIHCSCGLPWAVTERLSQLWWIPALDGFKPGRISP